MVSYLLHHDTLLQNAIEVYYKIGQLFHYKMRQFYYEMWQLLQNTTFIAKRVDTKSYGTEQYVNVYRGVCRTQSNIYNGASLQKLQKNFIVDVALCSKYASGINFTVEKAYKISIFI